MKKNRISKNWIIKQHKDLFFKQSKIQGYRSRSAFKLIEMNKNYLIEVRTLEGKIIKKSPRFNQIEKK